MGGVLEVFSNSLLSKVLNGWLNYCMWQITDEAGKHVLIPRSAGASLLIDLLVQIKLRECTKMLLRSLLPFQRSFSVSDLRSSAGVV